MRSHDIPVATFMDMTLHLISSKQLQETTIKLARERRTPSIIAYHNLHSAYLIHRDPDFRRFFSLAEITYIDGMSLVGLGRLFGRPVSRVHRSTNVDWAPSVFEFAAESGWTIAHVGSTSAVAERSIEVIKTKYPTLCYVAHHGFFDPTPGSRSNEEVLDWVARYEPQLLYVGMGMPRQELWIMNNLPRISAGVIIPSGGFMDFVTGALPTPPRWLSRLGFEWLARLMAEPRRLAKRYLIEPVALIPLVARELASSRKWPPVR